LGARIQQLQRQRQQLMNAPLAPFQQQGQTQPTTAPSQQNTELASRLQQAAQQRQRYRVLRENLNKEYLPARYFNTVRLVVDSIEDQIDIIQHTTGQNLIRRDIQGENIIGDFLFNLLSVIAEIKKDPPTELSLNEMKKRIVWSLLNLETLAQNQVIAMPSNEFTQMLEVVRGITDTRTLRDRLYNLIALEPKITRARTKVVELIRSQNQ